MDNLKLHHTTMKNAWLTTIPHNMFIMPVTPCFIVQSKKTAIINHQPNTETEKGKGGKCVACM